MGEKVRSERIVKTGITIRCPHCGEQQRLLVGLMERATAEKGGAKRER